MSKVMALVVVVIVIVVGVSVGGVLVSGSDAKSNDVVSEANLGAVSQPLQTHQPFTSSASAIDFARLLTQASFGVSQASLVEATSYDSPAAWVDAQIALPATLQLARVQEFGNASLRPPRHYVWWDTAVYANDQLRQRVAFALSEIFVVSDIDYTLGNAQHGVVHFYDMLTASAFGNFRTLLEEITLHPVMGIYLSMIRNEKANPAKNIRPDENYAREIMQLFTVGLYELNAGGMPTPNGNPVPAYTQGNVEEYARVFTGWDFADSTNWQSNNLTQFDKITPMVPHEQYHDTGSKQLLGGVVAPAGLTAREDLAVALDSLFNHPNVGPFIGKSLIQKLVTSNPSEQYVARVTAAFNDNGLGVRGDMGAVVKAILLDTEARLPLDKLDPETALNYGKLKEPIIKATQILRALNATAGEKANSRLHLFSKSSDSADDLFGQAVLSSPSVFNFFSPSFRSSSMAAGDASQPLYSPELQILTESLLSSASNDLHSMLYDANSRRYKSSRSAMLDIEMPIAFLRKGRGVYLEHMNMLLMSGNMSDNMQAVLSEFISERVEGVAVDAQASGATDAMKLADQQLAVADEELIVATVLDSLFMILASPEFMVQR